MDYINPMVQYNATKNLKKQTSLLKTLWTKDISVIFFWCLYNYDEDGLDRCKKYKKHPKYLKKGAEVQ